MDFEETVPPLASSVIMFLPSSHFDVRVTSDAMLQTPFSNFVSPLYHPRKAYPFLVTTGRVYDEPNTTTSVVAEPS